jgi:hypothetical protein
MRNSLTPAEQLDQTSLRRSNAAPFRPLFAEPSMSKPVESSDRLLAQYLGSSLQAATLRLAAGLIILASVAALVIKLV